jgi:hypothetical protein
MRLAFLITGLMALTIALPGTAVAAAPVVNVHTGPELDSFADELCGIAGTSTTRFVGDFKLYADGTYLSTSNFREVFTDASTGKQVELSGVENVTGPFNPTVDSSASTLTQTFVFKGLPMKISLPGGPTLVRDAGSATVAITFALNPDGSRGDFLSQTVLVEKGPHPLLDDDALFCNVVVSALGGP